MNEQPRSTFITSLVNRAGDVQANINRNASGWYIVTITDTDSGMTLSVARLYPTYGAALAYATDCVTNPDDDDLPF